MKNKSDVFGIFKKFYSMVEREIDKPLKDLKNYCSNELVEYCTKHETRHDKSVLYTPQHNEVVERMNRILSEKLRSMLSSVKLSKCFGAWLVTW